jgi:ABC-type glycerol-3-phosphate transport system substrate-binding protein
MLRRGCVLKTCLVIAVLGLVAGPIPALAQQPVTLDFVVWEYLTQTIRGFADRFEGENPGIKVNLNVLPFRSMFRRSSSW